MRAPAFWWKPAPDALALMLSPLAAIYGAGAARRMRRTGERIGAPVICLGNFVAGGAGKTPTAIAVARELIDAGEKPFFLSRGYGATRRTSHPLLVDQKIHTAADVGDEPLLLARVAPAIVCADRLAGARRAVECGASVIVMDDGLQNPALAKDLSIAVIDATTGAGNGLCIPAGPLRAPLDAQLALVDALVVIGEGAAGDALIARAGSRGLPVVRAVLSPEQDAAESLRGRRVVAFAGIGRPEKFFDTLREVGAELQVTSAFADHHPYTAGQLSILRELAMTLDAQLVTTEKDLARIGLASDIKALPVTLAPRDPAAFRALALRAAASTASR